MSDPKDRPGGPYRSVYRFSVLCTNIAPKFVGLDTVDDGIF